jgi:hypothetical protein
MVTEPDDGDYSPEEAERRFEAALRAALTTPPKPLKDKPKVRPRKAAATARDRAASPSGGGGPSASSPRGGRGRP